MNKHAKKELDTMQAALDARRAILEMPEFDSDDLLITIHALYCERMDYGICFHDPNPALRAFGVADWQVDGGDISKSFNGVRVSIYRGAELAWLLALAVRPKTP